jgi:glucose-6-phosphate 1-dehydrogenase
VGRGGDPSGVSSVASFFVSRVDTEADRRLTTIGTPAALALRGRAAVANAKLAYELFQQRFSGSRWEALAARGAQPQRPLWASTSTKNPDYPDLLYVDTLIGPHTVNTMPEGTLAAFEDHGKLARTVDAGLDDAHAVVDGLAAVGVDFADVGNVLEDEGVAAFAKSFDELIQALTDKANLVGLARTRMSDDDFRKRLRDSAPDGDARWHTIVDRARYVAGGYDDPGAYTALAAVLDEVEKACGASDGNRLFYLAAVPAVFDEVITALGSYGKEATAPGRGWARVVIEKPFGRDLESAKALDALCHRYFDESQIYRIDHYLGKETVQNVLALRFANAVFEPIWNRQYVDHVQVTVAEQLGVEGRAGFYETAGALRDIVQNHLMQVVAMTGMEPPASVEAKGIRDEKVKVIQAIEVLDPGGVAQDVVRGQYLAGAVADEPVPGYREEPGVAPGSQTETYLAMKLSIDNWRWAGVPFYVRTGKRLAQRVTEVSMQFQAVPHLPFAPAEARGLQPNSLVLRIQPDEGITLTFGAKVPGQGFTVRSVDMDFSYARAFSERPHDGYERLLLDALIGDPTLFIRADEAESAWRVCQPILDAWAEGLDTLAPYRAGSWGPAEAARLLERDGRHWQLS